MMFARVARTRAWDSRRPRIHTEVVSETSKFQNLICANILGSTTLSHALVGQFYAPSTLKLLPTVSC
jgi:hypothetical protein